MLDEVSCHSLLPFCMISIPYLLVEPMIDCFHSTWKCDVLWKQIAIVESSHPDS